MKIKSKSVYQSVAVLISFLCILFVYWNNTGTWPRLTNPIPASSVQKGLRGNSSQILKKPTEKYKTTASGSKRNSNNKKEATSTYELKVWISEEEPVEGGGGGASEKGSRRDNNVTCYPRLFEVDQDSSVRASAACDAGAPVMGQLKHRGSKPVHHIFFLKTHKTGSRSLACVLNRYAVVHNLSVAIKVQSAQSKKQWFKAFRPLPPGLGPYYDMITAHVRFDEPCVRHFLPRDAVFVSIVREPLDNFVSAFYYYNMKPKVPGPVPVITYLSNLTRWDTNYGTFYNNRMAFDFGLDYDDLQNPRFLNKSIAYLSRVFHLVLLTEAFDESLVLLKRTLSWTLPNMLYIKLNVGHKRPTTLNITSQQRRDFEKTRQEDYAIYNHFRSEYYKKVRAEDDTFPQEVKVFTVMRSDVEAFCEESTVFPGKRELRVEATQFSPRFRVALEDCQLLGTIFVNGRIQSKLDELMIQRVDTWRKNLRNSEV